jgi:hypothetical protein
VEFTFYIYVENNLRSIHKVEQHNVRRPGKIVCPSSDSVSPNSDKIYLTIVTFKFLSHFNSKRDYLSLPVRGFSSFPPREDEAAGGPRVKTCKDEPLH